MGKAFREMKKIEYIIFAMFLCFSCLSKLDNEKKDNSENNDWIQYSDTIDYMFVVTFRHPDNFIVSRLENSICIYNSDFEKSDKQINVSNWCIWMEEESDYAFDSLVSNDESYLNNPRISWDEDTITIDNMETPRMILSHKNLPVKQVVVLEKYCTLFGIVNNNIDTKDNFKNFCESLTITEYIKPSP